MTDDQERLFSVFEIISFVLKKKSDKMQSLA